MSEHPSAGEVWNDDVRKLVKKNLYNYSNVPSVEALICLLSKLCFYGVISYFGSFVLSLPAQAVVHETEALLE